ncbi:hypothetical protein H6F93_04090 [Leptolyngbya sp. FACHB-671]|nr:hypothetical protein [Leptolyngbya sp. FACHB-671]
MTPKLIKISRTIQSSCVRQWIHDNQSNFGNHRIESASQFNTSGQLEA